MQGKHLFEYAVIRIMPKVEREEFLNAGVILYCAKQRFLKALVHLDEARLFSLCQDCEPAMLEQNLQSFTRICAGDKEGGPIALLDMASRFRWLTAMRSTIVQTSRAHPGFCADAADMLQQLYVQMVL